ncbi:hypothetical protein [Leptolyngbya ohadii]|uniref:hypothetical protein n=1 Tax=Leptolyngbya ohadii TaxID=1962290 RepID=UPI00117B55F1|nr:hypothetical protein [Leptolyngbya ohadii]
MRISDEAKLKFYPVAIGIMGVCLLTLLFTRIDIVLPTSPPLPTVPEPPVPPAPVPSPTIEPSPIPSPSPTPVPPPVSQSPSPTPAGDRSGSLKVSNQTTHPVRVALLFQQSGTENKSAAPPYNQPVHWDFAPGEGGNSGLLMSLPDGDLQVKSGDVLMAFAEDGSRRYWGPFVVGRTNLPSWNAAQREWTLLLQQ